jgi:hypothetical protein
MSCPAAKKLSADALSLFLMRMPEQGVGLALAIIVGRKDEERLFYIDKVFSGIARLVAID